jgi:ABC-type nitrate/sulfonate/bicarbonate transport system substrate-binding protein
MTLDCSCHPERSEGYTALAAGQIDAGVMSPPTNARAKRSGFAAFM